MRDPGEGGLDRAMALSLSAVVSAGCLRFFVPWASTVLARAIDITWASAPASIQERKLREKSERRNEMREKRSEWGFSSREEAEREEWNDGCFIRPTYCWKGGGFVIWWLIGHYCGATTGVPPIPTAAPNCNLVHRTWNKTVDEPHVCQRGPV